MLEQKNKNQEKLIKQLKDMFQFEHAELDFGIYRIMNEKIEVINKFLEEDLPSQIATSLTQWNSDSEFLGNEDSIYSHLLNFFSRYYDEGDFISQRRFKDGVYAIPYEGEEIKLHWANADQFYIKTTENFVDYEFKTEIGKVIFKLVQAAIENANNKGDKKIFRLTESLNEKIEVINGNLVVYFEYVNVPKSLKQSNANVETLEILSNLINGDNEFSQFVSLFEAPLKGTSRFEKELNKYTAKNTFDYFIHKNLKSFLNRELDNYIKNEVIFLDNLNPTSYTSYLIEAKVIKEIGTKIIAFLAQIEEFQKKLWLKKKFIYKSDYCISLDKIPEYFYEEISQNKNQIEEWKLLFKIDSLEDFSEDINKEFLCSHKNLLIDTKFFSSDFKFKLLSSFDNIEDETTGVLINSDNFHALNLLTEKYREKIDVVYIDPPYNSPSSEILYKNNFKHSSWLSLMHSRLLLSKELLSKEGSHVIAIDKNEFNNLYQLVNDVFPQNNNVSVAIQHNKKGNQGDHFSYSNEYGIFSVPYSKKKLNEKPRIEADWEFSKLRNWGSESDRNTTGNTFFPIYIQSNEIIGYGEVLSAEEYADGQNIVISAGELKYYDMEGNETVIEVMSDNPVIEIWPIDDSGNEKKWRYEIGTIGTIKDYLQVVENRGIFQIEIAKRSDQFKTMWNESIYNAGDYGTKLLTSMGFAKDEFQFPKSIYTVIDSIYAVDNPNAVVLDYFAGSGTTAPAVMELNRAYGGNRKFILVEMGKYFEKVTKSRVLKSAYSFGENPMDGWKDGLPTSNRGYSSFIKYFSLESYDDSLNNIKLNETEQIELLGSSIQEEYILHYMLDVESQGSPTYLNIDAFTTPFDYHMGIIEDSEVKNQPIDLIDTFNYLIGLNIKKYLLDKNFSASFEESEQSKISAVIEDGDDYHFVVIDGIDSQGKSTLVIWRNITGDLRMDNVVVEEVLSSYSININAYDKVYINGDSYLVESGNQVIQIEFAMKSHLFELEDI